jgi:hypothetical protein
MKPSLRQGDLAAGGQRVRRASCPAERGDQADDFEVVKVDVIIADDRGGVIESGPAAPGPRSTLQWSYCRTANAAMEPRSNFW